MSMEPLVTQFPRFLTSGSLPSLNLPTVGYALDPNATAHGTRRDNHDGEWNREKRQSDSLI
jgi:hypothetical protein